MDATTGFPREIELKLDLPPDGADGVGKLLRLWSDGAKPKVTPLAATYYDTPQTALRTAGVALRMRREGQRWLQTAKAGAPGSLERFEWEAETPGGALELNLLADTPVGDILGAQGLAAGLQPAFSVDVTRTSWVIAAEGAAIEVSLDRGEVRAGERTAAINELELELKAGQVSALFSLARTLSENIELTVSFTTKAERGYALLAGPKARIKGEKTGVRRGMGAGEALQAIARSCLRQLAENRRRLQEGGYDADAVHQARVAMRRLRAALNLYAPALQDPGAERLGEALRNLGATLGEARNLDVFRLTPGDAEGAGDQPAPEAEAGPEAEVGAGADAGAGEALLQGLIDARRTAAHAAALAALEGEAFRTLLLDAVEWLETGQWLAANPALDAPVEEFAAQIVEAQLRKVHRRGRKLEALDAPGRHRLRIACKKLRYGLEFFAPAARGKAQARQLALVDKLKPLQDLLGQLNDMAVAQVFLAGLAQDAPAAAAFAAGRIACAHEHGEAGLLRKLDKRWSRFKPLAL